MNVDKTQQLNEQLLKETAVPSGEVICFICGIIWNPVSLKVRT